MMIWSVPVLNCKGKLSLKGTQKTELLTWGDRGGTRTHSRIYPEDIISHWGGGERWGSSVQGSFLGRHASYKGRVSDHSPSALRKTSQRASPVGTIDNWVRSKLWLYMSMVQKLLWGWGSLLAEDPLYWPGEPTSPAPLTEACTWLKSLCPGGYTKSGAQPVCLRDGSHSGVQETQK